MAVVPARDVTVVNLVNFKVLFSQKYLTRVYIRTFAKMAFETHQTHQIEQLNRLERISDHSATPCFLFGGFHNIL